MSNSNFNPATYLYLNPELQAFSNVTTIEQARAFYLSNVNGSNLPYSLSSLDPNFNARVFIHSSKNGLDVSALNEVIRQAMSNDGYSDTGLLANSEFMQSIQQPITYTSNNTFYMTNAVPLTPANLIVGDDVMIVVENESEVISRVTAINSNTQPNTFTVSNYANVSFSNASNVELFGQRLYDAERLGIINWIRGYRSPDPYAGNYVVDTNFNPELYRLLYPDARHLTNMQSMFDYLTYRADGDLRIGTVGQFIIPNNAESLVLDGAKLEWSSNNISLSMQKAVWSSNYTGSFVSSDYATSNFAPSNSTNARLNALSNTLSNYLPATSGYNVVVGSIGPALNNSVQTSGNWSFLGSNTTFASNVGMSQTLSVAGVTTIGTTGTSASNALVLDVHGAMRADDYILTSDARTKVVVGAVDTAACLEFVKKAPVVSFVRRNGTAEDKTVPRYGFRAQDLEALDASVVRRMSDFLPNVMARAAFDEDGRMSIVGERLPTATANPRAGDTIKVVLEDGGHVTAKLTSDTVVDHPALRGVEAFVYGTRVDDFAVIDNAQLFAVVAGALQRLAERFERLERFCYERCGFAL
jgi:hypothetical protein